MHAAFCVLGSSKKCSEPSNTGLALLSVFYMIIKTWAVVFPFNKEEFCNSFFFWWKWSSRDELQGHDRGKESFPKYCVSRNPVVSEERLPHVETVKPRGKTDYGVVSGDSFRGKLKSSSNWFHFLGKLKGNQESVKMEKRLKQEEGVKDIPCKWGNEFTREI